MFERKKLYDYIFFFNNRKVAEIELKEFYQLLRYHLLNIKVSTRLLSNMEIVELIYEQLYKENKNKVTEIKEKEDLNYMLQVKRKKKLNHIKKKKNLKKKTF